FFDINTSPMASAFIIVSINTAAYMAEVVRGGINAIDKGQVEAAKALGMNHRQTMIYIILPQVFKNIIPNVGNEFIVNIKDTSVLNVISVNELFFTTKSIAGANFRFFQTYFIASAIYLILTLSITGLLRLLEKKLEGDSSYVKVDHDLLSSGN
ncbi:amino acid ABC transporter permease, partial [uncultured Helcococcus sp.]|uniref:amino acid ABC transporter permease n=1 Tax=uncultured Helcococcus sp. TaxID=1072508 RepID=UPI00288BE5B6